jgi:hypothetical protein
MIHKNSATVQRADTCANRKPEIPTALLAHRRSSPRRPIMADLAALHGMDRFDGAQTASSDDGDAVD